MGATRKVLDYTCFVKGVFGRNRTVKTITLKLKKGVDPAQPLPEAEVFKLAHQAMLEAGVRADAFYKIDENPVELEEMDGGVIFERFVFFSERCLKKGTFDPLLDKDGLR